MIPFNFEYYKPTSIDKAIELFQSLNKDSKNPIYFNGGTEIITYARTNRINTKAVIDIKGISQCNEISEKRERIVIGSSVTLINIINKNIFPLLGKTSRKIADLTVRNKITLGGNTCGKIIFKEAILPLLLSDSILTIATKNGLKTMNINLNYKNKININNEEFIINFMIDKEYASLPNIAKRVTRIGNENYPLVTIASLKKGNYIRVAFSGIVNFPFRSIEVEEQLNNRKVSKEKRIENAISCIPYKITSNIQGSAEYKKFVISNSLMDILNELEEVN